MEVRLTGTEEECADAVLTLTEVFEIRQVSRFYPNRGITRLGRVFVEVDRPAAPPAPSD